MVTVIRDNRTSADNRVGRFVVTRISDRIADGLWRFPSEQSALEYAASLGFSDVLFEDGR